MMTERRAPYRIAGRSSEHEQQATVAAWAKLKEAEYPELALLFAVPNGGKRAIRTAARLKAEGVKAGVPDLWLPVPRDSYHGLVIEMKWGKNVPDANQTQWLHALFLHDYQVHVCHSAGEAIEAIEKYLRLEQP